MLRQRRPQSFLSGREMTRLGMMVCLLVLLFMFILRMRDPGHWTWLTNNQASEEGSDAAAELPPAQAAPAIVQQKPGARPPATPAAAPAAEPPLDQDPEEIDSLEEELQLVNDRTLTTSAKEMEAYWRLMRWARSRTPVDLARRAQSKVVFNDFVRDSDAMRGKLYRLDVNVRRILSYNAEPDNPAGVKTVYELVGATDQSQAWLYFLLTDELPAGMPQGLSVNERVSFYGYFLKLQGYHEGGAKPNARPLFGPLLIGRVVWRTSPTRQPEPLEAAWPWWVWAGIVASFAVVLTVAGGLFRLRRHVIVQPASGENPEPLEGWFSEPIAELVPEQGSGEPRRDPAAAEATESLTEEEYLAMFRPPEPPKE